MRVSRPPVSDIATGSGPSKYRGRFRVKTSSEFLVISFRIEFFLIFPFSRMEIAALAFE